MERRWAGPIAWPIRGGLESGPGEEKKKKGIWGSGFFFPSTRRREAWKPVPLDTDVTIVERLV